MNEQRRYILVQVSPLRAVVAEKCSYGGERYRALTKPIPIKFAQAGQVLYEIETLPEDGYSEFTKRYLHAPHEEITTW